MVFGVTQVGGKFILVQLLVINIGMQIKVLHGMAANLFQQLHFHTYIF